MSLLTRVFLANAAVLLLITLLLLFSPIEISYPVTETQSIILLTGFIVSLVVNLALLRGLIQPLHRLTETMKSVNPMEPGRRIPVRGGDADVRALTAAFNDMLERLETERRESGRVALAAQEEERRRVARELHDEVGQVLTSVILQLDEGEAREAVRGSLEDVRRIARELRPEVLDNLGLNAALRELCTAAAANGLRVERRLDGFDAELRPEVELVLYRIAQEALTNVLRHSGATEAVVSLETVGGGLRLTVRDNGNGQADLELGAAGSGIAGMSERALYIGGRLSIASGMRGTEVRLDIPEPGNGRP